MFVEYLKYRRWLIYLRKSRQDDPAQTVEEVLSKHETMLQEYAEREFGGRIPEENIYREVVSGESIDDRVEIKKVLARIEESDIEGVLVVEPSRLSRGDLGDCDRIVKAFRFSDTLVGTLMMTYNLKNKMERKFFQDELLRGNEHLEYTKEILFRGRVAAVKRGCYIGHTPPYGYDRAMKGDDHTLKPNPDEAPIVKLMFEWYADEGLTPFKIARRLDGMNVKAPKGEKWSESSIRDMLRNKHYIGKVIYRRQCDEQVMENGVVVKKRVSTPLDEVIEAKGKHDAIIDMELWDRARARGSADRTREKFELTNPLATLFLCSNCGRTMRVRKYKNAENRFTCPCTPACFKSVRVWEVNEAVEHVLEYVELPKLQLKVANNDGDARKIQERRLVKLEKEMEEYLEQEDKQYDLLETGTYTQEVFDRRNGKLREKINKCQDEINKVKRTLPKNINYAEHVVSLEKAIAAFKNPDMTPGEKNKILKSIISKIEYTGPKTGSEHAKRGVTPFTLEVFLRL
jgi:hypothetical protein